MGVAVPSPPLQAAAAHLPSGLLPCSALPLRCLTFAPPGSHRPGERRGPTGLSARSPERKGLTTDDRKSLGRAGRTPLAPYPPCPSEDPGPARSPLGSARNEAGSTFSFPGPRGRPRLQRRHPTVPRPPCRTGTAGAAQAPAAACPLSEAAAGRDDCRAPSSG